MTTVLDSDLANSNLAASSFDTVQVLLGGQLSTQGLVLAGRSLAKWTVVGMTVTGKLVAWNPAVAEGTGVPASGTLTFAANPAAAATLTLNGTVITFRAGGAVGSEVNIGTTTGLTAAALTTYINAHSAALGVTAGVIGNVVTLTANTNGTGGNAYTLAISATNPAVSAATLAGGVDEGADTAEALEGVIYGVLAQPVNATAADSPGPVFYAGLFNADQLVWPAGITTLAQRRAACVGSKLQVTVPL